MEINEISLELGRVLRERGLTIATAESCTAGGIAAAIASVDGASEYLVGGVVTYATDMKKKLLGVTEDIIRNSGVVSRETALAMNAGVRALTGAHVALSITGYAGSSGGDEFAENGTIWICAGMEGKEPCCGMLKVSSDRSENLRQAVLKALEMVVGYVKEC